MTSIVKVESNIFLEMDRKDQQQIVAAATGEVIEELVYKVKGKTAISWMGINHISFFMGDIEIDEGVTWERIVMFGDRVYWAATVRARNLKYNLSSLGTAEAPELAETHALDDKKSWAKNEDGSWKMDLRPDQHCRRKALSMAQRNAKRAVIPAAVLKKWLDYFLDLKKAKTSNTGEVVHPPFQPKYVDATITNVKTTEPKKTNKKKKTKKREEVPEEPPEENTQTELSSGKVTLDTVKYNLKAVEVTSDLVGEPYEEDGNIIVEAARALTDAEHYQVFGTLQPMGAKWVEKGYHGLWSMPKRE